MLTALGPTTLVDGDTYTSVNGRVYLPDLRNKDGWRTNFIVLNNGIEARNITIYYLGSNGVPTPYGSETCSLAPNEPCGINAHDLNRIPAGSVGQAFIDGAENINVAVVRYRVSSFAVAAYSGMTSSGMGSSPGTTVYIPLVQRSNNGNYNDLIVMNTGSSAVSPTVYFQRRDQSGDLCPQTLPSIAPNGSVTLSTLNVACLGTGFVGSARITGSQRLAVVSTQWKDYTGDGAADSLMDDEGVTVLAGAIYFPLLQRGNVGRDSGIALQNPNGSNASVTASYYNQAGGGCGSNGSTILNNSLLVVFPVPVTCAQPFVGSGRAASSQPLAGIVNHILGADRDAMSHSLLDGNTKSVVVPLALKNTRYLDRDGWYTSLSIQNASASTATVTVFLYDSLGNWVAYVQRTVALYATSIVYPLPNVPDGFFGSAYIFADQNISVSITNEPAATAGEDTMFAYPGVNR